MVRLIHPNRRAVLAGCAAAALTPAASRDAQGQTPAPPATAPNASGHPEPGTRTIKLRILETTDLHVHIANYDYYRDAPDETVGLAKLATLIERARAEAKNVLLFDNGDFNQGNPVGDYVALEKGLKQGDIHPMIRAMNLLEYDAGTLGNHEFNYGLEFLDACLAAAEFPLASANVARGTLGASARDDTPFINPYLILEREVYDEAGYLHPIKIGVIGFTPPQIMQWDEKHLRGTLETRDMVEAAIAYVPEMREAGADIVVALAHTGIVGGPARGGDENAALYLSRVPGIDVILTGHQHRVFPGPDYASIPGADIDKGTLNGIPTVMAGFWGSHLGQIDLTLLREGDKFRIVEHKVGNLPIFRREAGKVIPLTEASPAVIASVKPEHEATLTYVRKPVGRTKERIETYFALIEDCAAVQLVSSAQLWYGAEALAKTPHASLKLLSAAAPFKAGGRGGPNAYTDVPAGEIAIRNVADLYVFPNTLKIVKITGAEVQDWLERSAGIFNQIMPGDAEQVLINPSFPAYNFDVIDGVTYEIDVTAPSKFDSEGKLLNANASRIRNLAYQRQAVRPDDVFAVVTNNYRATGGGNFAGAVSANVIYDAPDYSRDILARYIAQQPEILATPDRNWSLAPVKGATAIIFETSPAAKELATQRPRLKSLPDGANGFARYRIELT